jgi:hypothetical protein
MSQMSKILDHSIFDLLEVCLKGFWVRVLISNMKLGNFMFQLPNSVEGSLAIVDFRECTHAYPTHESQAGDK